MKMFVLLTILSFISVQGMASADNFPLASCAGWDGTLVQRSGTNGNSATIIGVVTQADVQEYCERDPGGETIQHGGKLSVDECAQRYAKKFGKEQYKAVADCSANSLTFFPFKRKPVHVTFPLPSSADTSCASGVPPLIRQFQLLCPIAAKKLGIDG